MTANTLNNIKCVNRYVASRFEAGRYQNTLSHRCQVNFFSEVALIAQYQHWYAIAYLRDATAANRSTRSLINIKLHSTQAQVAPSSVSYNASCITLASVSLLSLYHSNLYHSN
jgi:hypothetical protein